MSYFGSSPIQEGAAGLGDTNPNSFMPPPVRASQEGSLGEYFAASGLGATPTFYRPGTRAYREGSIGSTFYRPGTRAYREGSIGEYFSGLGAASAPALALDLSDPIALRELKTLMVMAYPASASATMDDGALVYDKAWFTNGVWDRRASALWLEIAAAMAIAPGADPQLAEKVTVSSGDEAYPNATGVVTMMMTQFAPYSAGTPAEKEEFAALFPTVSTWTAVAFPALAAPGGSQPSVLPPVSGGLVASSTYTKFAWAGAAGLAVLGAYLVLGNKKKSRSYSSMYPSG